MKKTWEKMTETEKTEDLRKDVVRIFSALREIASDVGDLRTMVSIVSDQCTHGQAMPANQVEHEKKTRDEVIAKLNEIKRIAATLEAVAKTGRPVQTTTKEFLKKISTLIVECRAVIDGHAQGDRFSDATLHTVSKALREINRSIDSVILYAAIENPPRK